MLSLRPATLDDAPKILAWRNEATTVRFSGTHAAVTDAQHLDWMARRLSDPSTRIWIAEAGGVDVGQIRLEIHGDTAEVHIAVAPDGRGQGYGRAMIRDVQSLAHGFEGVRHLTARVHLANIASTRVFAACGFEQVSVEGEFAQLEWPCAEPSGNGARTG